MNYSMGLTIPAIVPRAREVMRNTATRGVAHAAQRRRALNTLTVHLMLAETHNVVVKTYEFYEEKGQRAKNSINLNSILMN